ncbi:MAG: amidohydrolase family protein [Phycisphaera sp.]|nr:amidohydrolase family protein [Phycisphaera sp.]
MQMPTHARVARPDAPSNRLGLDYGAEATRLPQLGYGIIDVHAHINGLEASALWAPIARAYGVERTYSMSRVEDIPALRERFGDALEFIAFPDFMHPDRREGHGDGYLRRIERYREHGVRIVKFWNAPRITELAAEAGDPRLFDLGEPARLEQMKLAERLGMMCMVHVADPDTWFRTKYKDAARYGAKLDHYTPLRRALDRFAMPWIAAHMGGFPEDLAFLDALLEAHPNLHLDTSATKWMVRELGRHPRDEVVSFLAKWRGRILFGTDTVTTDDHLRAGDKASEMAKKATSRDEAHDLYASRYWALRMMWEASGECASPISDPDLHMVDPERHTPLDAPPLKGLALPSDLLRSLYRDAAIKLFGSL